MEIKKTERGYPAHFCCADKCSFHRNTLIEYGDVKVIVSTVGSFRPMWDRIEKIGCGRYYETESFHAVFDDPYFEADVNREIHLPDVQWMIDNCEHDADMQADLMHEEYVAAMITAIMNGNVS